MPLVGTESDCSYLPGRPSLMEFRWAYGLTAERYRHLLERGWRRFGRTLFRPKCRGCNECQSLRVDVNAFRASKSQRRTRSKNSDVSFEVVPATMSAEHLDLYNQYHLDMHERRGWPVQETTPEDYADSFLEGDFGFNYEFQYRQNDRLVAVGLVDRVLDVMSSLYFYHLPEFRQNGLGVFSVLCEQQYALQQNVRWLYMGYYIRDCLSMNYKNRYQPNQILDRYVKLDEPAEWSAPD
ncbi:MAG: arginyltransferase [Fuerstiella sp.]